VKLDGFPDLGYPSWLKDSETLELNDPETRRRMDADPMFRVEKTLRLGTRVDSVGALPWFSKEELTGNS